MEKNEINEEQLKWAPLRGASSYIVSNWGHIKRIKANKMTPPGTLVNGHTAKRGIQRAHIKYDDGRILNMAIAHLVLESHGCPKPSSKHTFKHIDGDGTNNHLSNLMWRPFTKYQGRRFTDVDLNSLRSKYDEDLEDELRLTSHDVTFYKYAGVRSCNICIKYPCMDRQKKGLTTFDFAAHGCFDYKVSKNK